MSMRRTFSHQQPCGLIACNVAAGIWVLPSKTPTETNRLNPPTPTNCTKPCGVVTPPYSRRPLLSCSRRPLGQPLAALQALQRSCQSGRGVEGWNRGWFPRHPTAIAPLHGSQRMRCCNACQEMPLRQGRAKQGWRRGVTPSIQPSKPIARP